MKKSIKGFLEKLKEDDAAELGDGFKVLKNIRGGLMAVDPESTNQNTCMNDGTCTSTNSHICSNNRCAAATNTGCTNYGSCRH